MPSNEDLYPCLALPEDEPCPDCQDDAGARVRDFANLFFLLNVAADGVRWPGPEGDVERFLALDDATQLLVLWWLRCGPEGMDDYDALLRHPDGASLARWLVTLPVYVAVARP